jgi:hypothetical protein
MTADVRLITRAALGSPDTTMTRDRLAFRSQAMDAAHPEALDLEAALLVGISDRLRGLVGVLAGTENATHVREGLRGDRNVHLSFLCRLATSSRPEAGDAIDFVVAELARLRGNVVTKADPSRAALEQAAAVFVKESGEAVVAVMTHAPNRAQECAEAVEAARAMHAAAVAEVGR